MRIDPENSKLFLREIIYKHKSGKTESSGEDRQGDAQVHFGKRGLSTPNLGRSYVLVEVSLDMNTAEFYLNASGFIGFPVVDGVVEVGENLKDKVNAVINENLGALEVSGKKLIDYLLSATITQPMDLTVND
ncbi:hypothetical protein [Alcaligenes sp. CHO6]|uniref:hypothetical protein n=1 Tax=Alcaligenes sp. CHO6 TaxID=3123298 RepID=UPI003014FB4C